MRSKRWRVLASAAVLLFAISLLPVQPAAAAGPTVGNTKTTTGGKKQLAGRSLTVSGLSDNQSVSGIIDFDVTVGGGARTLYVYSQISPFINYTSYSWGQWDARSGQVHITFDTSGLSDGMHMVTLYTRDTKNRMLAVGAFSIFVQNWTGVSDVASHFDVTSPVPFSSQKGNAVAVKLSDLKTGKVAAYEYHLAPLGFPYLVDAVTLKIGPQISQQVPIKGLQPGWYVLTINALDEFDRIIDKAAVTVEINPGK